MSALATIAEQTRAGQVAWTPAADGGFAADLCGGYAARLCEVAEDEACLTVLRSDGSTSDEYVTSEALADGWQHRPEVAELHCSVRRTARRSYFKQLAEAV